MGLGVHLRVGGKQLIQIGYSKFSSCHFFYSFVGPGNITVHGRKGGNSGASDHATCNYLKIELIFSFIEQVNNGAAKAIAPATQRIEYINDSLFLH